MRTVIVAILTFGLSRICYQSSGFMTIAPSPASWQALESLNRW